MTVESPGRFFCPCCQRKFKFVAQLAGKSVYCHCGAKIRCPDDALGDGTLLKKPAGKGDAAEQPAQVAESSADFKPPKAPAPEPIADLPAAKSSARAARSRVAEDKEQLEEAVAPARRPSTTNSDLDELAALAAAASDDHAEESLDALQLHDDSRDSGGAASNEDFEPRQQTPPQKAKSSPPPPPPPPPAEPPPPPAEELDELDELDALASPEDLLADAEGEADALTLSLGDDDDAEMTLRDEPAAAPARPPVSAPKPPAPPAPADDDEAFSLSEDEPAAEDDPYSLSTDDDHAKPAPGAFDLAIATASNEAQTTAAAAGPNVCPKCQEQRKPGTVLCLKCGFNSETGGTINTQIRKDEEEGDDEKDESFKEHLMMNLYVPLGMVILGILLILFNSFVMPNEYVIQAAQIAEESEAAALAWEDESISEDDAAAAAALVAEEDAFLKAQGIETLDAATAAAIMERQGDVDGDGQTTDVEFRIWNRAYDVDDGEGEEEEDSGYGGAFGGPTGTGAGSPIAGLMALGARIFYLARTIFLIAFAIPCIFIGMLVLANLFGNSFGAIIPAVIKLIAIIVVTQAVYDFCTSILLWMTDGINLVAYIGFSISMAVFWPLCSVFFDLDWMEILILYLVTFFAPYVVIGCLCLGLMA